MCDLHLKLQCKYLSIHFTKHSFDATLNTLMWRVDGNTVLMSLVIPLHLTRCYVNHRSMRRPFVRINKEDVVLAKGVLFLHLNHVESQMNHLGTNQRVVTNRQLRTDWLLSAHYRYQHKHASKTPMMISILNIWGHRGIARLSYSQWESKELADVAVRKSNLTEQGETTEDLPRHHLPCHGLGESLPFWIII